MFLKKVFKIPLKIHWSFIILPLLFVLTFNLVQGLTACALLVISILFHEYAHVWIALRNNIKVYYVVFFGFGAGAMIDSSIFTQHKKELKIAIAGPTASLVLAVFSFLLYFIFKSNILASQLFNFMFFINIAIAVFNILPLYPMDGGRVLNSIISMFVGTSKGINISVIISYIFGSIGILFSLLYHMWWMAAVFVVLVVFAKIQKDKVLDTLGY